MRPHRAKRRTDCSAAEDCARSSYRRVLRLVELACRAEYDKRHQIELDRASARRRELRAQRRAARAALCATCGTKFRGKRKDARFCSDTCRQRAHRKHVTDKRKITVRVDPNDDIQSSPRSRAAKTSRRCSNLGGIESMTDIDRWDWSQRDRLTRRESNPARVEISDRQK
jgi:hypothetical protein